MIAFMNHAWSSSLLWGVSSHCSGTNISKLVLLSHGCCFNRIHTTLSWRAMKHEGKKKKKKIIVLNWHARWQENIECHTCVFQCTSLFIVKKCKRERETDSSAELVCRNMAQSLTSHLQQPVIHRFKLWSTEIPCTLYFST